MTDVNIAITTGIGADGLIYKGGSNNNYGTNAIIQVWAYAAGMIKSLLRFDLSLIPSGAIISAATLMLTSTDNFTSSTFNIYKITDANGDWIEGTVTGSAEIGSPCWSKKVYNTVNWAGSAGLETAGMDYVNTIIATATGALTKDTGIGLVFNAAGLEVLQSWFGAANNNGLLFVTTGTSGSGYIFHSKQATTAEYRPVLSITYTEAGGLHLLEG